jgi:hypothetical protein
MSDAASFAKFVPGFDFLQNLSKGTGGSNNPIPGVSSWVAPTLDPEELEKRITDLKAVLFWLEQNTTALKATIQALEVQKMTLATLKSMNMDMSAMAKAFQFPDFSAGTQAKKEATPAAAGTSEAAATKADQAEPVQPKPDATEKTAEKPTEKAKAKAGAALPNLDPLQLWGSLTQQFQQIATQALQDVTKAQASGAMAKAAQPQAAAAKTSAGTSKTKAASKKVAKKPAAKRTTSRKSI